MLGTTIENHQTSSFDRPSQLFCGIRFVLLGFDPINKSQVSRKLVSGGGVDAGQYGPDCTHVIVYKLVYDDPVCVAARRDGKILVSSLWIDHSFDLGAPVDTTSVMYRPVRDLNGIPGAKSLVICLTGYQREDREDIMTMVGLMGAQFSKPLIANKVTHLICYKFEGEKYLLAKKMKRIKLINHRWLEDCLKAWEILPEADYSKSGYELEIEAEAKDSEEEAEGVTARQNDRKIASPPHSHSNPHEIKNKHMDAQNVSSSSTPNKIISAYTLANKFPHNEARNVLSATRTTPPTIDMNSNSGGDKRLNKFNLTDAFNMSSSLGRKSNIETPNNDSFSDKRKTGVSCGSFELQNTSENNDAKNAFEELKDPVTEMSPAQKYPFNRKSLSSKGKNVICDVDLSDNVIQSRPAVIAHLPKSSNQNLQIDEPTSGSTSKSVKRKSTSKKLSAPSLAKKNTTNKKDSTFLSNSVPTNDQTENMFGNKFLCMDDETEPAEDEGKANKEKNEDHEPENAVDVVMEEKTEGDVNDVDQHNDENDHMSIENAVLVDKSVDVENLESGKTSRGRLTKKGKKKTANADKNTSNADMKTENVVNKKETKIIKRLLSKTKVSAKEVNDVKPVNKKSNLTSSMQVCVDDQSIPKKELVKPGNDIPEKNLDKTCIDVMKDAPMCFILTGPKLQRSEFQKIIRRLKGRVCRVSHQWSYQATHFIVPDPIRRTEKFFAAAASGRWILKSDYLSASNQAGKFLAEEPYEWHKNGLSEDGQINLEAPRKWRLLKEKTGHGAFYGMRIITYGDCIAPTLDTLKRVVKAGDGTILATSPPYTRFLNTGIDFAIVSPGMPRVDLWVQEFIKHEIPCVYADYLVEYVCKPGYPLERHVQYDTNIWAERSYNKLKKQLEEEICEPRTPQSDDVACEVCGSRDRGDEMLICGDEKGLIGCGAGTHIDCCDPPLDDVPEEDWFCGKCSKKPKAKKSSKRKRSSFRG